MKKRFLALLLTVLTVCNLLIPAAAAEEPATAAGPQSVMATYYVSPDGSDDNNGTSSSTPFKTLEKTRDTVRSVNESMTGDIVVYLMDGTWELESTLTFGKEDSGANGHNIWYKAYDGAKPMLSGGTKLTDSWEQVTVNDVTAYKTTLDRDVKLRALYVNGERRYMAHMENAIYSFGPWLTYEIKKGTEDWAWADGAKSDCFCYHKSSFPADFSDQTRNVTDIEIENQFIWNKNIVCVREIRGGSQDDWDIFLQQPYGAIAQTPGWGVNFSASSPHVLHNAYEFLDQPGEFYFDRAGKMLYYIPMAGENMVNDEVVVPRLETVVEFRGTPTVTGEMGKAGADNKTITGQVKNVIFDGISVAHSDWNLQKVGNSYGKSTVQAGTVYTAYASGNWHADMYRNLGTLPGAVEMEFAHNVIFRNGEVKLTGGEGVVLSNDVDGCQVIGNFVYQTGGGGVLVGHPQHVYENDALEPDTYYYQYDGRKPMISADGAEAKHEKYQNGTERAPRDVKVSNNFLLENCRLFPSHCPITSYYTQRMEVSNNFIKDAAYSGMSIGWGWGNFDGETNGNRWGTENDQGYAIIPNIPTEVCRDNRIINNRLDGTMTILHDGGLIYTLGKQDNTLIAGNYGRGSESGLYPDEGSAMFAPLQNNVVADLTSRAFAGGQYGRKHDLLFKNNYSNNNIPEAGPDYNIRSEDFHYIADSVWPKAASDIIQNSGLTAEYRARFAGHLVDAYGSEQDALMPAMAWMYAGEQLTLNAWLDEDNEIWLAPAGTTKFTEGAAMTKAAGNAASMDAPSQPGTYYLYAVIDGMPTAASHQKLVVRDPASAANVKDGAVYPISAGNPLTLELDTQTYTFKLNGQQVESGHTIREAGAWKLEAFSGSNGTASLTFTFTTRVLEANKLLPDDCWMAPGDTLTLAAPLDDTDLRIWLAPVDEETFNEVSHTWIAGDKTEITLPAKEGQYHIALVDTDGMVVGRSNTMVTVSEGRLPLGDTLRLAADDAAAGEDGVITQWANAADSNEVFMPVNAGPTLKSTEDGISYVSFNGENQSLRHTGFDFNGKEALTVIVMAKPDDTKYSQDIVYGGYANGDAHSPLYASEAAGWSGMYVSPYEKWVGIRFGSTVSNCYVAWERPDTMTAPSVTGAVKDSTTESIYVNGSRVHQKTGQAETTRGIGDTLYIGNSIVNGNNSYFCGDLYEVLIYDRALTEAEMQAVSDSLLERYPLVPTYSITADTVANGTVRVSHAKAAADTQITVSLIPDRGYRLKEGSLKAYQTGNPKFEVPIAGSTFTMPACAVTVTAEFEAISYQITYDLDGGGNAPSNPASYTVTSGFTLAAPAKDGYTFAGWTYSDVSTPAKNVVIPAGTTGNLTFQAHWAKDSENPPTISVTGVSLNADRTTLAVGETKALTATVAPANATNKNVTWSTSDASVAAMANGVVTAVGAGTATIAVTTVDGNFTATCAVTVTAQSSTPSTPSTPSKPPQPGKPAETEKPAPSGSTEVKAPTATTDAKGEATTNVSNSQMNTAITEAAKENKAEIVVEAKVDGDATKVSVEVPKTSVGQMANQTEAALTVKTDIADVKIPVSSLEDLSKKSGGTVTVSAEITNDAVKIEVKIDSTPVEKLSGGVVAKVPAQTGNMLVVVNADGTETIVKKSIVDGSTVAGLVDGSCTVKIVENNKTFADTGNHWAKDAVEFAASRELFQGTSANSFSPNAPMSRAMLATVLYRLEDAEASGNHGFADVPNGTWYTDAVTWAGKAGIVSGTGNGFNPNGNVTREQLATMLYRYAGTLGMDTAVRGGLTGFTENGRTSGWAKDAMTWAVDNGLVTGKGNSQLDPTGTATRAEVAAIMQRMVGLMVK